MDTLPQPGFSHRGRTPGSSQPCLGGLTGLGARSSALVWRSCRRVTTSRFPAASACGRGTRKGLCATGMLVSLAMPSLSPTLLSTRTPSLTRMCTQDPMSPPFSLSPELWAQGGAGTSRGQLPGLLNVHQESETGHSGEEQERGASGAVREASLEDGTLERAAEHWWHSPRAGHSGRHSQAGPGQLPPATTPADLHCLPWMPAWEGSRGGGAIRPAGHPSSPSAHLPAWGCPWCLYKASPKQLTQQHWALGQESGNLEPGFTQWG